MFPRAVIQLVIVLALLAPVAEAATVHIEYTASLRLNPTPGFTISELLRELPPPRADVVTTGDATASADVGNYDSLSSYGLVDVSAGPEPGEARVDSWTWGGAVITNETAAERLFTFTLNYDYLFRAAHEPPLQSPGHLDKSAAGGRLWFNVFARPATQVDPVDVLFREVLDTYANGTATCRDCRRTHTFFIAPNDSVELSFGVYADANTLLRRTADPSDPVPEPSQFAMFSIGGAAIGGFARYKKARSRRKTALHLS